MRHLKSKFFLLGCLFYCAASPLSVLAVATPNTTTSAPQSLAKVIETSDESDPRQVVLERIVDFLNGFYTKKAKGADSITAQYKTWLKSRPTDHDLWNTYYVKYVLKLLARPGNFELLAPVLFNQSGVTDLPLLSEQDRMVLLLLCIQHYSMKRAITITDDSGDAIAPEDFYDFFVLHSGSRVYELDPHQLLFVWCEGAGAHNAEYFIWLATLEGGKFTAKPLEIPSYDEASKSIKTAQFIVGKMYQPFNSRDNTLTFLVNASDTENCFIIEKVYKFERDHLTLIKQHHTEQCEPGTDEDESSAAADSAMASEQSRPTTAADTDRDDDDSYAWLNQLKESDWANEYVLPH